MDWETCRDAFVSDSFPRYIRARGLTLAHWNRYYRLLCKTQAGLRFYKDGEPEPLPERLTDVPFRSPHRFMLVVDLAGLKLIWRLREIRDLQFEFAPEAISTPERAVLLFRIMTTLGRRLKREVVLTHPYQGRVLFRYCPESGQLEYLG